MRWKDRLSQHHQSFALLGNIRPITLRNFIINSRHVRRKYARDRIDSGQVLLVHGGGVWISPTRRLSALIPEDQLNHPSIKDTRSQKHNQNSNNPTPANQVDDRNDRVWRRQRRAQQIKSPPALGILHRCSYVSLNPII
jgi:hypothetical protein